MKVGGSALFEQGIGLKFSNRFSPPSINLTSQEPRPIPCLPGSQLSHAYPGGDGLGCAGGSCVEPSWRHHATAELVPNAPNPAPLLGTTAVRDAVA